MKFTELNLKPELLAGLEAIGYTELTEVQEMTFPHILSGRDMIARAETGSGKTAACAVPLVQTVDPSNPAVQALILVPTRELALQYVQEIAAIAKRTPVAAFAVYGGFAMDIQVSKLTHGVQILVATPGRLIDLLYNTPLSLGQVATFVLDEADVMLDMGFLDDVEFVVSCLVHEHQTLLFSATLPDEIRKLAQRYLKDPVMVELNVKQLAPTSLKHCFLAAPMSHRMERLLAYFHEVKPRQAIVFCNSRHHAEAVFRQLRGEMDSVEMIHGGLEQNKRTSLFRRFRRQDIRVMVATDVAGRGLDFEHVSHVINYDFPTTGEAYTHRTGRTARMGREGMAVTLYGRGDLRAIKRLVEINRIEPIWIGEAVDLSAVSGRGSGSGGRDKSRRGGGRRGGRRGGHGGGHKGMQGGEQSHSKTSNGPSHKPAGGESHSGGHAASGGEGPGKKHRRPRNRNRKRDE